MQSTSGEDHPGSAHNSSLGTSCTGRRGVGNQFQVLTTDPTLGRLQVLLEFLFFWICLNLPKKTEVKQTVHMKRAIKMYALFTLYSFSSFFQINDCDSVISVSSELQGFGSIVGIGVKKTHHFVNVNSIFNHFACTSHISALISSLSAQN